MATHAPFFFSHNRRSPRNALINLYCTADGQCLLLIAPQPEAWPQLVMAMRMPQLLKDARYSTEIARDANAARLVEQLDSFFASHTLEECKRMLDAARIIHAVIEEPLEILSDEQMIANAVYSALCEPLGGACPTLNAPLWLVGYAPTPPESLAA